jgi:hypothetical protein
VGINDAPVGSGCNTATEEPPVTFGGLFENTSEADLARGMIRCDRLTNQAYAGESGVFQLHRDREQDLGPAHK